MYFAKASMTLQCSSLLHATHLTQGFVAGDSGLSLLCGALHVKITEMTPNARCILVDDSNAPYRERDSAQLTMVASRYPRSRSRSPRRHSGDVKRPRSPLAPQVDGTPPPKQKPNFGLSGALAAESKTSSSGKILKYHEPPEAAAPRTAWRLYEYKGEEELAIYPLGLKTAYLFGRDRLVVDIPIDHSSCSKQHAVIQFREIRRKNEYGDLEVEVKPYLIDLESTNKSYVNKKEIPESRYYELISGDSLAFGDSARDFVMLREDP